MDDQSGSDGTTLARHIGERIRVRRNSIGLSRSRLARLLGVDVHQMRKYETGLNQLAASRLFDLSVFLDVPVAFFFDDLPDALRDGTSSGAFVGAAPVAADDIRREAVDLVGAYYRIRPSAVRRRVYDLIRSIGHATPSRSSLA